MGSLLASLLPGLRDLRAPLTAGYLWLAFGWVVFRDRVNDASKTNALLSDVHKAVHDASLGERAALATFAGYLLGALSIAIYGRALSWIVSRALYRTWPLLAMWRLYVAKVKYPGHVNPLAIPAEAASLPSAARYLVVDLAREAVSRAREKVKDEYGSRLPEKVKSDFEERTLWSPSGLELEQKKRELAEGRRTAGFRRFFYRGWWIPAEILAMTATEPERLASKVAAELSDFRTQLIQRDPQLFNSFDRLASEAEFRWCTFPPLVALTIGFARDTSPWWLFVILAAVVLLLDGMNKSRAANAVLVEALRAGVVQSRALASYEEELRAYVRRAVSIAADDERRLADPRVRRAPDQPQLEN